MPLSGSAGAVQSGLNIRLASEKCQVHHARTFNNNIYTIKRCIIILRQYTVYDDDCSVVIQRLQRVLQ